MTTEEEAKALAENAAIEAENAAYAQQRKDELMQDTRPADEETRAQVRDAIKAAFLPDDQPLGTSIFEDASVARVRKAVLDTFGAFDSITIGDATVRFIRRAPEEDKKRVYVDITF